jgi:hypothetical protein
VNCVVLFAARQCSCATCLFRLLPRPRPRRPWPGTPPATELSLLEELLLSSLLPSSPEPSSCENQVNFKYQRTYRKEAVFGRYAEIGTQFTRLQVGPVASWMGPHRQRNSRAAHLQAEVAVQVHLVILSAFGVAALVLAVLHLPARAQVNCIIMTVVI